MVAVCRRFAISFGLLVYALVGGAFAYTPPYPLAVDRPDGLGAQLKGKLSCMLQAAHTGEFFYVHTPFRHVEHLKDDKHGHIAEHVFNLGYGEVHKFEIKNESSIIQSGGCQDFSDNNARLWNTFRYRLRQKLFLDRDNGPTKRSYFSENAVWIVAHIRRGDISLGDRGRGSSFSDIFRILSNVTAVCRAGGRQCRLTVHTEKLRSDVAADLEEDDKQIEQLRAQLAADVLRDAPPLSAWIDMVNADILVDAKGTFSQTAAWFNAGIVVHQAFTTEGQGVTNFHDANGATFTQDLKAALEHRLALAKGGYGWMQ